MNPFISIIIPTYNRADVIIFSVQSVLVQKFNNWEMIIVDDGSEDNTKNVLKNYIGQKNITYISINKNMGVGFARNRGIENAKGDWILLLDSDCTLFPNSLNKIVSRLYKFPDCLIHMFSAISDKGENMGDIIKKSKKLNGLDYLNEKIKGEFQPLVKKHLFENNSFSENVSGGEGTLWTKLALTTNLIYFHNDITLEYGTKSPDRLSIKRNHYYRLYRVFLNDINELGHYYMKFNKFKLIRNFFKVIVYYLLYLFFVKAKNYKFFKS